MKDRRSGAVTIVQRFGGSVNLNVHYHAIVFDGVFATDGDTVRFHPCPPLDAADVDEVLATVTAYVGRLLAQRGSDDGDDGGLLDEWADEAPVLAGLAAASVQGRESRSGREPAPVAVARGPIRDRGQPRRRGLSAQPQLSVGGADAPERGPGCARLSRCGGRLTLIALIEDPAVIERILRHLGLPTEMPEACPA